MTPVNMHIVHTPNLLLDAVLGLIMVNSTLDAMSKMLSIRSASVQKAQPSQKWSQMAANKSNKYM